MKINILILALVLMATTVMADQLTPSEALARLDTSSGVSAAKAVKANAAGNLNLAYTSKAGSLNTYYAFNNSKGGYILLSADDCLPAVLGTVGGGSFDYDSCPENMKYLLSLYDAAVRNYSQSGMKVKTITGEVVTPLLYSSKNSGYNIRWGQSAPYSNCTPTYNGEHCLTCCVATAMAQVMAYYQWPKTGTGSHTYKTSLVYDVDDNGESLYTDESLTLSFPDDFTTREFKWEDMPGYKSDYTNQPEKCEEVARLMYCCGVSTDTKYGINAAGGSGAYSYSVAKALCTYFGYDKSIQFILHSHYTNEEWDNIIYNELVNGRPVIFGGQDLDDSNGHEFVCDGFNGEGLFHINWGWNGADDNFFYLTGTGLNPVRSNPGSTSDFNLGYGLDAIIGIKPDEGGTYTGDKFIADGYCVNTTNDTVLLMNGCFLNVYYDQVEATLGAMLTDANGGQVFAWDTGVSFYSPLDFIAYADSLLYKISVPRDILTAGTTYTVTPIYTEDYDKKSYRTMKCFSEARPQQMRWDGEKFTNVTPSDFQIADDVVVSVLNNQFQFNVNTMDVAPDTVTVVLSGNGIKNISDYNLHLGAYFYNDEDESYHFAVLRDANIVAPGEYATTIKLPVSDDMCEGYYYIIPIAWAGLYDDIVDFYYYKESRILSKVLLPATSQKDMPQIMLIDSSSGIDDASAVRSQQSDGKYLKGNSICIVKNGVEYDVLGRHGR